MIRDVINVLKLQICLFPLGQAQRQGIRNSKLIPFEFSGHALFYDEKDRFNSELNLFIEG